uniref:N-acetylglucosamine-1-phosphodiester alpha-N-acetylglucosaminidase-like n=1 Tax=Crassostrea virginica TaxID=6565 RepID=A0A8B8BP10_CRAVI|nr:N-acetylglucosamine-1-phosphodiester alpha-N-acetylglucosaminidase-like [Crassostrea virginica]
MAGMALLVCCGWTVLLCLSVQAYENLALHKPAWQSNTYWSNTGASYTADLAVDGQYTDLAWWGGQCAVSGAEQTTAEWRVDLVAVRSIHHIVIQYMTNNEVWDEDNWLISAFLGFSVYISNTTNKENGVPCFRDTNYTTATIPNSFIITCPYHGRYVIYYNNRTHPPYPEGYSLYAWVALCEVEVYGCPSPGYYGENCSLECPQNCQNGYCDIVEGTCFGCAHRYVGPTCEDCPSGLYGSNCSQNCSMTCGDPGECDMRTGHCDGGCQVGWTGAMCEKGFSSCTCVVV